MGGVHVRAVRSIGATVRGVVASNIESGTVAANLWGVDHVYRDFESALEDDHVDVVHICTPNALHVEQVTQAIHAGKHVICEKPLSVDVSGAKKIAALSESSGLVVAVPFVYRYHPLIREIRARCQAGEFGRWQLIHGSYLQDWMLSPSTTNWRVDSALGGPSRAYADIGSHWCDLVEWVAGVRFAQVCARLAITVPNRPTRYNKTFTSTTHSRNSRPVPVETEDVAVILLETEESVLGSLTISQVSPGRKNRLWFELDGTEASAVFDQENPETTWIGRQRTSSLLIRDPTDGSEDQRRLSVLPAGHPQGYMDAFTAFMGDAYRAIDGVSLDGLPTALDGVRAARLVAAVLQSDAHNSWTAVAGGERKEATV